MIKNRKLIIKRFLLLLTGFLIIDLHAGYIAVDKELQFYVWCFLKLVISSFQVHLMPR